MTGHAKALWAAGLCALALFSYALSGESFSGRVIDESTGKPVADAIVVIHWIGSWTKIFGESSSACYHVETARTDPNGNFRMAAWKTPWSPKDLFFSPEDRGLNVYKPGYAVSTKGSGLPGVFLIAPFQGGKQAYFDTVLRPAGCERAGASSKNEYRLYSAMAQEASALAETPAQLSAARMLRILAEESLVNFERPTQLIGDRVSNVDPKDSFKKEEVPQ
jgi:hypothetical protein